jgi:predicted membrane protein
MSANHKCQMNSALGGGAIVILIGVFLLMEQFGILPDHWFSFWAAIFFLVGGLQLLQTQRWGGRLWGLVLLSTGVALEFDYLGYTSLHLSRTWPVFIIAFGLVILVHALESPPTSASTSPHLHLFACMGGGEYRIQAKNFRGGSATAIMGGFDIDLRDADIEGPTATISLSAFMGGGVIRVPYTWGVQMRGSSFMGGNSMKVREGANVEKTLIVEGTSLLGGFEIRN